MHGRWKNLSRRFRRHIPIVIYLETVPLLRTALDGVTLLRTDDEKNRICATLSLMEFCVRLCMVHVLFS